MKTALMRDKLPGSYICKNLSGYESFEDGADSEYARRSRSPEVPL